MLHSFADFSIGINLHVEILNESRLDQFSGSLLLILIEHFLELHQLVMIQLVKFVRVASVELVNFFFVFVHPSEGILHNLGMAANIRQG